MSRAFAFLVWHSWVNRLRQQLARLRRPRYLLGAVIGLAYVWFFMVRNGFRGAGPSSAFAGAGNGVPEEVGVLVEAGAALVLSALVYLTWLLPSRRAFLEMTEGEVAFLVPAPIHRRRLVQFRLFRSQFGLLFTALIMGLVFGRGIGSAPAALRLPAWWLLMTVLELHRLTAAFGRTWLMDRGVGPWRRRRWLLLLLTAWVVAEVIWVRGEPGLGDALPRDPAAWKVWLGRLVGSGPLGWALWPGRTMAQAFLAPDTIGLLAGMGALLAVGVGLYVVLMRLDVPFEEATLEFAQRRSDALAAVRTGNWHLANPKGKARRPAFRLRSVGAPWVALWWKNLIAVKAVFGSRLWKILLAVFLVQAVILVVSGPGKALAAVLGVLTGMLAPMLVLMGPHLLRTDLRQDLVIADVLKAYPLRGWQVVLGEVLAPWSVLTVVQWALVGLFALAMSVAGPELGEKAPLRAEGIWAVAASVALILPAVNLVSLLLLNAAALLFPAWLRSGPGAGPGIESMGQGILLMFAHLFSLALAMLLPAGLGLGAFFLAQVAGAGWPLALCGAAAVASGLLLAEAVPAFHVLGRRFDCLDVVDERLT